MKYTTYHGKNVTELYTQNISGLHIYDYIRIETIDLTSNIGAFHLPKYVSIYQSIDQNVVFVRTSCLPCAAGP